MGKVPVCVGVPERTPAVERVKPVGKVLAVVKVISPVPPVLVNVWLNGVPFVPVVVPGLLMVIATVASVTVKAKTLLAELQ